MCVGYVKIQTRYKCQVVCSRRRKRKPSARPCRALSLTSSLRTAADRMSEAEDDLYGDVGPSNRSTGSYSAPQVKLASTVELRASLAAAIQERKALEAQLEALQAEAKAGREAIQDVTRRACVLLATARLELQRKDDQIAAAEAEARQKRKHGSSSAEPRGRDGGGGGLQRQGQHSTRQPQSSYQHPRQPHQPPQQQPPPHPQSSASSSSVSTHGPPAKQQRTAASLPSPAPAALPSSSYASSSSFSLPWTTRPSHHPSGGSSSRGGGSHHAPPGRGP